MLIIVTRNTVQYFDEVMKLTFPSSVAINQREESGKIVYGASTLPTEANQRPRNVDGYLHVYTGRYKLTYPV